MLFHFDWFGPAEELKQMDEAMKKACTETDGVAYKGRYSPNQKKFHWSYLFEVDNFACWGEAWEKMSKGPRDYKKLPYGELEYHQGPFHE